MCQPASTCRSQQFIFWRCVCRLASVCNAAWTVSRIGTSMRCWHVLQTCMYTIAYNTIEEFLRGLKSWVWPHMTKIRNIKLNTKTKKNTSANLVRSKSKIKGGSPNGTLILKHRCLASVVHSKLDYCNSLYYNLPKSQIFAYKVLSTSQPQYAIWSSQSVQPTCS